MVMDVEGETVASVGSGVNHFAHGDVSAHSGSRPSADDENAMCFREVARRRRDNRPFANHNLAVGLDGLPDVLFTDERGGGGGHRAARLGRGPGTTAR